MLAFAGRFCMLAGVTLSYVRLAMSSLTSRRFWVVFSLLVVVATAGCVQETRNGDSVKYTYELWVPLSILFGGAVGLVAGVIGFTRSMNYSWVLCLLGVGGLVAGPSMMCDYAVVDPQGFKIRTGIPFMASTQQVQFADVKSVRQIKKVTRGRRGRRTNTYYYVFDLADGTSIEVNISGNDIRSNARRSIDQQLATRGIQAVDETGFEP
jgi:hypothetical protein